MSWIRDRYGHPTWIIKLIRPLFPKWYKKKFQLGWSYTCSFGIIDSDWIIKLEKDEKLRGKANLE